MRFASLTGHDLKRPAHVAVPRMAIFKRLGQSVS